MQKKFGSEKTSHLDTFQAVIYATYSIMSFEDFQSPLAKHISRDYFQKCLLSLYVNGKMSSMEIFYSDIKNS